MIVQQKDPQTNNGVGRLLRAFKTGAWQAHPETMPADPSPDGEDLSVPGAQRDGRAGRQPAAEGRDVMERLRDLVDAEDPADLDRDADES